jgi:hypothetical protein
MAVQRGASGARLVGFFGRSRDRDQRDRSAMQPPRDRGEGNIVEAETHLALRCKADAEVTPVGRCNSHHLGYSRGPSKFRALGPTRASESGQAARVRPRTSRGALSLARDHAPGTICCFAPEARLPCNRVSMRQRQTAIVIALLLSVWFDAAWARPLRMAKEARATACCAVSCAQLRGVACNSGCCPTTRSPDGSAVSPAGKQDPTVLTFTGEPAIAALGGVVEPGGPIVVIAAAGSDPPAIFLLTRTLRL